MGYCFVCKAIGDGDGLYRLPKKDERRKMWLKNLELGIRNFEEEDYFLETKKDVRVCFRHFQDSDYRTTGTTRRLKPEAVPSSYILTVDKPIPNCKKNHQQIPQIVSPPSPSEQQTIQTRKVINITSQVWQLAL